MSRRDLLDIVTHIRNFISTANGGAPGTSDSLRLTGFNQMFEVELKTPTTAVSFERVPELITSVRYFYSSKEGAPIRRVTLDLGDYQCEVVIEGAVPEQVDGLLGVIAGDMDKVGVWFFGSVFRELAGLTIWLIVVVIGLMTLNRSKAIAAVSSLAAFAILIMLVGGPWSRWLPGTAVYPESASWLVRNSAIVSALGLVFTVLTFLVSIAYQAYTRRSNKLPESVIPQ